MLPPGARDGAGVGRDFRQPQGAQVNSGMTLGVMTTRPPMANGGCKRSQGINQGGDRGHWTPDPQEGTTQAPPGLARLLNVDSVWGHPAEPLASSWG